MWIPTVRMRAWSCSGCSIACTRNRPAHQQHVPGAYSHPDPEALAEKMKITARPPFDLGNLLKPLGAKVTRIARGVPVGGDLGVCG